MGKTISPPFLGCFYPIRFILASNKNMHKISDEFEFRPDRTIDYGVSCPWASKKIPHRLLMGKCWLHASSFIFDRIIIKVSSNQDRHKSSDEFDFGPDQTTYFGVTCPWMTKILHFWSWISLRLVGQSCSYFMCSITGGGERLHNVLRQIGSKLWCPWQQKAPIDNGENGVSTFSRLLLIQLAGNEDMHKISDEFEFRLHRTTDYGVSCPWVSKFFPIDL